MEKLTKEEQNLPVTYGELTTILTEMSDHIAKVLDNRDEETIKLFKITANKMVEIIDMLEYHRKRDLHYFVGRIAANECIDKETLLEDYVKWCEEFDKLNKHPEEDEKNEGNT